MKITVLGCGALGQLWLTALCKHGHEVQGWLRVPQPYCSVNLIGEDGSIFNESLTANDPDFLAQSDLLLVTLKAWQVSDAVKTLAAQLRSAAPADGDNHARCPSRRQHHRACRERGDPHRACQNAGWGLQLSCRCVAEGAARRGLA